MSSVQDEINPLKRVVPTAAAIATRNRQLAGNVRPDKERAEHST